MRRLRYALFFLSLLIAANASSATAANWDPANAAVTMQLATGTSAALKALNINGTGISCGIDASIIAAAATQSVARTTAAHNPVNVTNCSGGALGTMTATTSGTWSMTANSTTLVTLQAANGSLPVAQFTFHSFPSCTISVPPFDMPNNTWSNSTHNVVLNSTATVPIASTAGCLGFFPGPMTISGTLSAPAASIT